VGPCRYIQVLFINIRKTVACVKQFIDSLFESLPITNGKLGSFTDVERSIFIAAIEDVYTQITDILCASAHTCIPSVPKYFFLNIGGTKN